MSYRHYALGLLFQLHQLWLLELHLLPQEHRHQNHLKDLLGRRLKL
jgi:hypothetical protein